MCPGPVATDTVHLPVHTLLDITNRKASRIAFERTLVGLVGVALNNDAKHLHHLLPCSATHWRHIRKNITSQLCIEGQHSRHSARPLKGRHSQAATQGSHWRHRASPRSTLPPQSTTPTRRHPSRAGCSPSCRDSAAASPTAPLGSTTSCTPGQEPRLMDELVHFSRFKYSYELTCMALLMWPSEEKRLHTPGCLNAPQGSLSSCISTQEHDVAMQHHPAECTARPKRRYL